MSVSSCSIRFCASACLSHHSSWCVGAWMGSQCDGRTFTEVGTIFNRESAYVPEAEMHGDFGNCCIGGIGISERLTGESHAAQHQELFGTRPNMLMAGEPQRPL